jgi:hypothetical protein
MLATIRVSVFQVPSLGRLSVPIRRTFRRPPSHGTGDAADRSVRGSRCSGCAAAAAARIARVEDALDRGQGLEVVVGDRRVGAAHHEDDREKAGQRDRGEARTGRPKPPGAAVGDPVQVADDPVGIDGGHDPVDVRDDVADQDPDQDRRLEGDAQDLDLVAERHAGEEGEEQEGCRRERHGPIPGPRIGVTEPGEEQAEERRAEGRACSRACFVLLLHRG